jgi:O-acetyl-ADP-ribose deacetylase (regulator of RNase III)
VRYDVGRFVIEVVEGDITRADADAIVNAANNHLWMGAGVAGAIKRAGGAEIEKEAVAKGPIEVGGAVETTAGSLPHQYVIHGAVMGQDLRTDADLIARTTRSCLELADRLGLASLALPAFGTGVGGFPLDECAMVMVEEARDFSSSAQTLTRAVFVLFGEPAHQEFERAASIVLGG